ncbi:hypothetical protein [uncultured Shimia sp.]|uniref:hypothetical protein n=1 Tax=uncultured Shimia sp. TaxID=573152 RepID=UPI0026071961|nr:hypothetical protein [uncultured Shimia sp.]
MQPRQPQRAYTFNQWVLAVTLTGVIGPLIFVSFIGVAAWTLWQPAHDIFPAFLGWMMSGVVVGVLAAWLFLSWPLYRLMKRQMHKKRAASWGAMLGGLLPLTAVVTSQAPGWLISTSALFKSEPFLGEATGFGEGLLSSSGWILVLQLLPFFAVAGALSAVTIQCIGGPGREPKGISF